MVEVTATFDDGLVGRLTAVGCTNAALGADARVAGMVMGADTPINWVAGLDLVTDVKPEIQETG